MSRTATHTPSPSLLQSLDALKLASLTAAGAYQRAADACAHARQQAKSAHHPGRATGRIDIDDDHSPCARVLADIAQAADSHREDLSAIWCRTAFGYAYGVTDVLARLRAGEGPDLATAGDPRSCLPQIQLDSAARARRNEAQVVFTQVMDGPAETSPQWHGLALAWQEYALAVDALLHRELATAPPRDHRTP